MRFDQRVELLPVEDTPREQARQLAFKLGERIAARNRLWQPHQAAAVHATTAMKFEIAPAGRAAERPAVRFGPGHPSENRFEHHPQEMPEEGEDCDANRENEHSAAEIWHNFGSPRIRCDSQTTIVPLLRRDSQRQYNGPVHKRRWIIV